MKDFKTFVNENMLVPRNIEGRKEKLKQMNIRVLSQEVIDGNLELDESFMDIDAKFVKLKKVYGDVWLNGGHWTEIPEWLKDVEIEGYFGCSSNKLTTLQNCPQKIGSIFDCSFNRLASLEGCPENIGGSFYCYDNLLISLKGCPKIINGSFDCDQNNLISLEGCPENINKDFLCSDNKLLSLEGCPKNIGRNFLCRDNKVKLELPENVKIEGGFYN